RQSSSNRSFRPTEMARRLLARLAFEIAENDWGPVFVGKAAHLLVEQAPEVVVPLGHQNGRFGHDLNLSFALGSFADSRPSTDGRLMGDAVQPITEHLRRRDMRGLPRQDEKGGLKGVFGVLSAPENA